MQVRKWVLGAGLLTILAGVAQLVWVGERMRLPRLTDELEKSNLQSICDKRDTVMRLLEMERANNFFDVKDFPFEGLMGDELTLVQVLRMSFTYNHRQDIASELLNFVCIRDRVRSDNRWKIISYALVEFVNKRTILFKQLGPCECDYKPWECAFSPDDNDFYGGCVLESQGCYFPTFQKSNIPGISACFRNNFYLLLEVVYAADTRTFENKLLNIIITASLFPFGKGFSLDEFELKLDQPAEAYSNLQVIQQIETSSEFVPVRDDFKIIYTLTHILEYKDLVVDIKTFYETLAMDQLGGLLDTYILPILQQAKFNRGYGVPLKEEIPEDVSENYKRVVMMNYASVQKMLWWQNFEQIPWKTLHFHALNTIYSIFATNSFIFTMDNPVKGIIYVLEHLWIMMMNIATTTDLPFLTANEKCHMAMFNTRKAYYYTVNKVQWDDEELCPFARLGTLVDIPVDSKFKNLIVEDYQARYTLPATVLNMDMLTPDQDAPSQETENVAVTQKRYGETPSSYSFFKSQNEKYRKCMRPAMDQTAGCASCWAFASVGAFSHRYCKYLVDRNLPIPFPNQREGRLSVQMAISCVSNQENNNCEVGGQPAAVFYWLETNKITLTQCAPYTSASGNENREMCNTYKSNTACFAGVSGMPGTYNYGEQKIMSSIQRGGPVVAILAVPVSFIAHRKGVYVPKPDEKILNGAHAYHVVQISGWGTLDGIDYWIVENSWGEIYEPFDNVHHGGFLLVKRNLPLLGIEKHPHLYSFVNL